MWRARDRSRHRRDLDGNKSRRRISAQSTLPRLSPRGEQQAMSHPVPARDAADRLASLQGLFDKANLLVVTPSPPTLGAQHIDLHSPHDLKARLKAKSSRRLPNYTRRPPPEEYSKDTLLRVIRRRSRPPADPLRVIDIDDWAWRRNHRYAALSATWKGADRYAAAGP